MSKRKIIIIAGPTAVGKTDLTIDLARELNGEIVSCDSMQVYKHFDIGSAKPTKEEMGEIKHYLIDEIDPMNEFTVSDYQALAKKYIDEIIAKGKVPIITGGTGLYINSFLYNMDYSGAGKDEALRKELEAYAVENGAEALHQMLVDLDPKAAQKIHFNNIRKIVRALEIVKTTGKTMDDFTEDPKPNPNYDVTLIGITRHRKKLYARINKRVELMMAAGLIEEIETIRELGIPVDSQAMRGIGYKEVIPYIEGKMTREQMISLLKQNSRRYAKRQMTWLRRYEQLKWFDYEDYKDYNVYKREIKNYIEENL